MKVEFVNAEVLTVGTDEVLIIKLGNSSTPDDLEMLVDDVSTLLGRDRFLIIAGDDIELSKVKA